MSSEPFSPGAHVVPGGVSYRVWAPETKRVDAVLFSSGEPVRTLPLTRTDDGYFQATDPEGRAGDLYKFRLDGDEGKTFPDPLSRYQPEGVHGPSQVMPSGAYAWKHDSARPKSRLDESGHLRTARRHVHAGGHLPRRHR